MGSKATPGSDLVGYCLQLSNETNLENANVTVLIECIARTMQKEVGTHEYARSVLLVFAASLIFFMQAGFAMVCAGAVRKKNIQNTLLKNLLDACGASLAWYTIGYAFAFGGSDPYSPNKTFIGVTDFFLMNVEDLAFWMFQYAFSAASVTIIAGTLAERCQMAAYLSYSLVMVGWVYPIVVHAIWNPQGFLSAYSIDPLWGIGMIDFAGSGVVHITGGTTALFATVILGPRRGRFHDETGRRLEKPKEFPGSSMSLQMLGTLILWFGWYGFNCGSALPNSGPNAHVIAALAGVNTTLSAGAAGITALFLNLCILERMTGESYFDLKMAMNGSLAGLVAVTSGCGVMEPWGAVITGIVAGTVYLAGSKGLVRLRLDDAVDAIPVHMLGGMWGVIACGLFASPRWVKEAYGNADHAGWVFNGRDGNLLACQLVGILFICSWVTVIMFPFFVWLDWRGWFRSDPLEEIVGLDTSYHGGLFLLGGEDEVNPEFISAFKQRREEDRLRRRHVGGDTPAATVMGDSSYHGNDDELNAENFDDGRVHNA
ncbi:ammonium transporter Amt3 [Mayamaea pseudoterrestris]|nr:ammonium transporter Amt3 [Mayamaea pseudoterrestris]